jgi:phage I-like protein
MNPEQTILANAAEGGSPFAILQGDSFFIPFGEFPHKQGLQIFDRTAAEEIAGNHQGLLARLASWARGDKPAYPVYIGHPDLPGSKDTDKRAYGWIENMSVEAGGLRCHTKWSDQGREMVENGHFRYYSPLWWTRKTRDGIRPSALKSMGLTNDPNIPVPALANEAGGEDSQNPQYQTNETEIMNPEILAALGLEEAATPEEVLAKITAHAAAAEAATTQPEPEPEPQPEPEPEPQPEPEPAVDEEKEKLKKQVQAAANTLVLAAVSTGRLTPAEADDKLAEILAANDFPAALADLGKLPVKVKTVSVTGDLGGAKARLVLASNDAAAAARAERALLVANEFAATNPAMSTGERKRLAWQRAQAKHPEVFGKPEPKDSTTATA